MFKIFDTIANDADDALRVDRIPEEFRKKEFPTREAALEWLHDLDMNADHMIIVSDER